MATQHFSFAENAWNPEDWMIVRSPRWNTISTWVQEKDHITNTMPEDITLEEVQMGQDRAGESYISMLLKQPVTGHAKMSTVCSFDERMAPLIVLARELGPVHHEHLEIVLYDRGINLWHHFYIDGKPSWKLIAFIDLDLAIDEKHTLTAEMIFTHTGRFMLMGCDGRNFGCRIADDWPETYYAGFTGCEGRNSFYDFEFLPGGTDSEAMKERFSD